MSTIIVYKRTGLANFALDPFERQNGMLDAGSKLRTKLASFGGSANDDEAEDRVRDVLDRLISDMIPKTALHQYEVRLEESRGTAPIYKIAGGIDNRQRYILTHKTNLATDPNNSPIPDNQLTAAQRALNGRLKLDIGLDNLANANNVYKMRVTVPRAAANSTSWGYLSTDIFQDAKAVEAGPIGPGTVAENIEDYLISTFTFSRCR